MSLHRKYSKIKITVSIFIPLIIIAVFLCRQFFINISRKFPKCPFYEWTGFYCPACGNTRSVLCLLKWDIIGSLRNNITPLLLAIILFFLYIEFVLNIFEKKINILPKNSVFWFVLIGTVLFYYLLRNFADCMAPI
ncbi:MAG: DUF2752 domain-containing protein [Oscillospiraceae bacterium]|nr:DUF2752 domain-containing protein [Oscillospiraceae bacterium]